MVIGRPTTPGAADFPAANLPASAQSWARAVAQRIAQLEAQGTRLDARVLDQNKTLVGYMHGGHDGLFNWRGDWEPTTPGDTTYSRTDFALTPGPLGAGWTVSDAANVKVIAADDPLQPLEYTSVNDVAIAMVDDPSAKALHWAELAVPDLSGGGTTHSTLFFNVRGNDSIGPGDDVYLEIDGQTVSDYPDQATVVGWSGITVDYPPGAHTLRWVYSPGTSSGGVFYLNSIRIVTPVTGAPTGGSDYAPGDAVRHNNATWLALSGSNPGNEPGVDPAWAMISAAGANADLYTADGIRPTSTPGFVLAEHDYSESGWDYFSQVYLEQDGVTLSGQLNSPDGWKHESQTSFRSSGVGMYVSGNREKSGELWTGFGMDVGEDGVHPRTQLVQTPDYPPPGGGVHTFDFALEAGYDSSGVPYVSILGERLQPGWNGGAPDLPASATNGQVLTWNGTAWVAANLPADNDSAGAALPASATTGQVLTWNGTSWDAETLPSAATGGVTQLGQLTDVDESTPPASGQTLTWNGTKWAPATPAAGSSSGGGSTAGTTVTAIPTTSTAGWTANASYGTLTSDGTELKLVSTNAGQFARYYQGTTRAPAPLGLGQSVLQFDIKIDSANANGGSAGMVMTNAGELGDFAVRIDVDGTGRAGMRFETDQQANLQSVMPVPGLTLDAWHTIRMVRLGASAAAYLDGVKILAIDNGPTAGGNAATLLMFGANQVGMTAHYRNISVTTTTAVSATASPPASSGSSGEVHTFASAGQWTINHSIGRIPSVTVYDAGGNLLLAEAAATSTQVVITFANPTAGTAVLT